MMSNTNS